MKLGIWIETDKGTQFAVTRGDIRALTPNTPLPGRVHDIASELHRLANPGAFFDVDLRKDAADVVSHLYEALKSRL